MNNNPSTYKHFTYLKSGSARKEAYFNVSLHGTSDLTLSSSSTYCNGNKIPSESKKELYLSKYYIFPTNNSHT